MSSAGVTRCELMFGANMGAPATESQYAIRPLQSHHLSLPNRWLRSFVTSAYTTAAASTGYAQMSYPVPTRASALFAAADRCVAFSGCPVAQITFWVGA